MINYWLIPAFIVFVFIMILARHDECNAKDIHWLPLLGTVIVWPVGAAMLLWLAVDSFNQWRE